jgi:hypothetical protein
MKRRGAATGLASREIGARPGIEPKLEFRERRIECLADGNRRQGARAGTGFPDDVQADIAVGNIFVVVVLTPVARMKINFDIARLRDIVADLHDGIAKIRAGLAIPEAGVKNGHRPAVQRAQGAPAKALVAPHLLQEALGGRPLRGGFPQTGVGRGPRPPTAIEIAWEPGHDGLLFAPASANVKLSHGRVAFCELRGVSCEGRIRKGLGMRASARGDARPTGELRVARFEGRMGGGFVEFVEFVSRLAGTCLRADSHRQAPHREVKLAARAE